MMFLTEPRAANNRALMIEAHMAAKAHPFVRLEMAGGEDSVQRFSA
jgi:hypothetical protein